MNIARLINEHRIAAARHVLYSVAWYDHQRRIADLTLEWLAQGNTLKAVR